MSQVMPRQQGDIHPSDVDLLSPGFLNSPEQVVHSPSPHSLVSNWSQLSQGSRLSADSSYRDDLLLPCSRDPSSEEGSDSKDLSEEELESVEECKELRQNAIEPDNDCCEQKLEDKELQRIPKGVEEDEIEALIDVEADTLVVTAPSEELEAGEGENFCDNDEKILNLDVAIKCVTANGNEVECQMPFGETTELTQNIIRENAPDINDLDTVIEDVIPKKKNKKRRKHAKKKKTGGTDHEEDRDDEEDIPVEA